MLLVRSLNPQELKTLCKEQLIKDFTKDEIDPYFEDGTDISEQKLYTGFGGFIENRLQCYAIITPSSCGQCLLIAYYACLTEQRGKGLGTKFLEALKKLLITPEKVFPPFDITLRSDGKTEPPLYLVLEVEDYHYAHTCEEKQLRIRRMHFWEKNGFTESHVRSTVSGCHYIIMASPILSSMPEYELPDDKDIFDYMEDIYTTAIGYYPQCSHAELKLVP